MLNDPWINPTAIDYTDSFNPLARRGYNKNNARFVFDTLQDPAFMGLRQALGIEARIWVCPDPTNQSIAPHLTSSYNVPAEPNTWLFALNAISNPAGEADPAGFLVQIIDSFTGSELFSQPVVSSLLYSSNPPQGILNFISAPRLFVPPAYPIVQITNLSNSAQVCIVNLFCDIETDIQPIS
jgi:hypothetical protein